jgi:hypothetical protein
MQVNKTTMNYWDTLDEIKNKNFQSITHLKISKMIENLEKLRQGKFDSMEKRCV